MFKIVIIKFLELSQKYVFITIGLTFIRIDRFFMTEVHIPKKIY